MYPVKTKQGLKLCRYGGLSGVPQVHSSAPCRNGIHAFVWPFIEKFLLGGQVNTKSRRGDRFKDKYRVFFHKGPLYCRFDIPNAPEVNGWVLTDHETLFTTLLEHIHRSRVSLHTQGVSPGLLLNPYGNTRALTYSRDHLEVFIPHGA